MNSNDKNSKEFNKNEKERLHEEYENLDKEEKRLDAEIEGDGSGNENAESEQEETPENQDNSEEEQAGEEGEDQDNSQEEDENKEENEEEKEEEAEEPKEPEEDSDEEKGSEEKSAEDSKEKVNSDDRRKLGPRQQGEDKINESKNSSGESLKDKALNKATEELGNKSETVKKAMKVKDMATKGIAAAKSTISGLGTLAQLLVNPIFWIAIGIIVVLIAIISAVSIIGGNDYNKLCDSNGVGSVLVEDDVDDFTRQSAIAAWLMSTPFEVFGGQPMTREQAMGVMGNFIEESYGANPKTIQNDASMTRWENCGNDCVGAFVGGGQAVGILQWDGQAGDPRRDNLVALARAEGTEWWDLNTQLKHLKMELDAEGSHTYENHQIKKNFTAPGKSVEYYTEWWATDIERCGTCRMDDRKKSAKEFDSKFSGSAVSGGGGMVAKCVGGGGSIDTSSVTQLAMQISYTREEKKAGLGHGNCKGNLNNCGMSYSKPEYIAAKELVGKETGEDPIPGLLASCDRLVATMVRATGMDEKFPYGNTGIQINYMEASPDWKRVSCKDRQAGDVFGRSGHIMIYVGEIEGQETVVSASIGTRSAHMSNISCSGDLFHGDAMSVQGYRKVN